MNYSEAIQITKIAFDAIDNLSTQNAINHSMYRSMRSDVVLHGYDIIEIDKAFKIQLANWFLLHSMVGNFETEFTKSVKCSELPTVSFANFIPDDFYDLLIQFDILCQHQADTEIVLRLESEISSLMYRTDALFLKKASSLETMESFSKFILGIGADDQLYWQKIYTKLELEYTDDCPRCNECIEP